MQTKLPQTTVPYLMTSSKVQIEAVIYTRKATLEGTKESAETHLWEIMTVKSIKLIVLYVTKPLTSHRHRGSTFAVKRISYKTTPTSDSHPLLLNPCERLSQPTCGYAKTTL